MQACIPPTDIDPLLLWTDEDHAVEEAVRAHPNLGPDRSFYARRAEYPIFFAVVTFNLPMIQRLVREGRCVHSYYYRRGSGAPSIPILDIFLRALYRHRHSIEVHRRAQPILKALLTDASLRLHLRECVPDIYIRHPCVWRLLPTMEQAGLSLLHPKLRRMSGLYEEGADEHARSGFRELQEQRFRRAHALYAFHAYEKALPNELWVILFTMLTHMSEKEWLQVSEARQRWLHEQMRATRHFRRSRWCGICFRSPCRC